VPLPRLSSTLRSLLKVLKQQSKLNFYLLKIAI